MSDSHLSIGEVLGLLQDEFPDVTISKIRFLESQGLIDPERTPSGYRKFYDADIERLRWILIQQRENFLPLKVIKDRLDDPIDAGNLGGEPTLSAIPATVPGAASEGADGYTPAVVTAPSTVRASMPAGEAPQTEPIWMADLARTRPSAGPSNGGKAPSRFDREQTDVSLNADELVSAAGISAESLRELIQYGLVVGRAMGDDTYFDGDALVVARKAGAFMAHGIGARHLRMFKVAADREAGFLEQVAMPLLKQRNPDARRQAVELVEELADLGNDLRVALLRSQLRHHLDRG